MDKQGELPLLSGWLAAAVGLPPAGHTTTLFALTLGAEIRLPDD